MNTLAITPATKVADLLEAYPQLEAVLVDLSSHFKALQNPILRRTVAKVATLEKAARMSGVPVRQLILSLRQAVGQPTDDLASLAPDEAAADSAVETGLPPDWLAAGRVRDTIDADALLAAGEHPVGRVQRAVRDLEENELLCIQSAFRPIPLIEMLAQGGHRTYVREEGPGVFRTFIARGQ